MTLPRFSVERRVTITMFILIIVVLGLISLSRLALDLLPDIEYPAISVLTTYPGVGPREMEALITKPVEEAVATVSRVKSIKSFSQEGVSVVMVEFDWGTDVDYAAEDVRDIVGMMQDWLPAEASRPIVVKFSLSMMPIVFYGVIGIEDTHQLKKLMEDVVKERVERIDGVASCMVMGGLSREILVSVDKGRAQAYGLSLSQIVNFLRSENLNISGGHLKSGYKEWLVRTEGEYKDLSEVEGSIVGYTKAGTPIHLKDIAHVEETYKEVRSTERIKGKEGVILVVLKASGANPLLVSRAVEREIDRAKEVLPEEIEFHELFSQGEIVEKVAKRTGGNILWGGVLAVLAIFLFLRSWRPTLVIGIAIPFSLIATFIAIHFSGHTLNLMTLGGLALGVGMLVDNAIVVIENIFRHMEEGEDRKKSSRIGAEQVTRAITASTITTIVVFLPLVFAGGIAGRITKGLALTVAFALGASLLVALTIIPMVASLLFRRETLRSGGFERARQWYREKLSFALSHRRRILIAVGALFLLSIGVTWLVGGEFMPKMDRPFIVMMLRMPPGTNLEETDRIIRQIEDRTAEIEGVESVGVLIGLSEATQYDVAYGTGASDVNEAQIMVRLEPREKRGRTSNEVLTDIRKILPSLEGLRVEFFDPGQMMVSGGEMKPIDIKIIGPDLEQLKRLSGQVASEVEDIRGIEDVETSVRESKPELRIRIDRDKAASFGLTNYEIGNAVSAAVRGVVATRLRKGGEETDIRVKLRKEDVAEIEDVESVPITTRTGVQVLLKQVASIEYEEGPVKIEREERARTASVTANLRGRDLRSSTRDIKRVLSGISFPTGYLGKLRGEYEEMTETFITLGFVFALAILLVYMVMASAFESLSHPFIIMSTLPLAWIGVAFLLLFSGKNLSLVSGVGVIILAGIVVNNGIVMIDYVNRLRRKGLGRDEAILEGASVRLRPILITAVTTILGMLPMALSRSEGAEMRSPMAIAVIGGLLCSTILTLIVVPILYSIMDDFVHRVKGKAKRLIQGE